MLENNSEAPPKSFVVFPSSTFCKTLLQCMDTPYICCTIIDCAPTGTAHSSIVQKIEGYFSYFSLKPYVATTHLSGLDKTVQMRGHNIGTCLHDNQFFTKQFLFL